MKAQEEPLPWLTAIEKMEKQKSYKPILLLSIIAEIEAGNISENRIPLVDSLTHRFDTFYKDIGNQQALGKAYLPYYHLQSDVWTLHWDENVSQKRPSSIKSARINIKYASFKPELYEVLKNQLVRDSIKERLFLKAEEDIKIRDPIRNDAFFLPNNIPKILERNFGRIRPHFIQSNLEEMNSLMLELEHEKRLQELIVEHWDEITEFRRRNLEIYGEVDKGVEYGTGIAGRIDILAEDKKTNNLTVIELKRGVSGERHIGQLLRYMGWVRTRISKGRDVFGILIAQNFQDSIHFAIRELPTVTLMKYKLMFHLSPVKENISF